MNAITPMPRATPEWIGRTHDTPIPPRVRLRVLARFDHACANCGTHIRSGARWDCDHKEALILGGENRENNLRPLCKWCHGIKTHFDVHAKSVTARQRMKHYGIKRRINSRPLPGTVASGWKHFMSGGWEQR